MQHVRISQAHQAARARRDQDGDEVLPLDPRDPEIIRAKRLQMAVRSRTRTPPEEFPT
jgi:hypothetical protein